MKKYKIIAEHSCSYNIPAEKVFDTLNEAVHYYDELYHAFEKNEGFRGNGRSFTMYDLNVKFIDLTDIKPLIYLASTYTHNDPKIVEERFQKVAKKAAELMCQGMTIFSPIAMCHPMALYGKIPGDWDFWKKFDTDYISCCNKLIVYRLDGWEKSKGVQAEIKIAQEMGIPIEYID